MTISLFTVLLNLELANSWAMIHPPKDPADYIQIQKYIDAANSIQHGNSQNPNKSIDRMKLDIAKEKKKYGESSPVVRLMKLDLIRLEAQRDIERQKAIELTMIAYGIVDVDSSGKKIRPTGTIQVPSIWDGKNSQWAPTVKEEEARKFVYNTKKWKQQKGKPLGVTIPSGISVIYEEAFADPKLLAITLFHERYHFEQYTSPDGARMTDNEEEEAAYKYELTHYYLFGLTSTEIVQYENYAKRKIKEYHAEVVKERANGTKPGDDWNQRDAIPADDDVENLIKESDFLEKIVGFEIEEARKERAAMNEKEARRIIEAELKDLSTQVCDYPGGVQPEDLEKFHYLPDASQYAQLPNFFQIGCAGDLYVFLLKRLSAGERLNLGILADEVRRYNDAIDAMEEAGFWGGVDKEVRRCGFYPLWDHDDKTVIGFGSQGFPYYNFRFNGPMTMDAIKTSLMVARACADTESRKEAAGDPCNDSFSAYNNQWRSAGFQAMLAMPSDGASDYCYAWVERRLKAPLSAQSMTKTMAAYQKHIEDLRRANEHHSSPTPPQEPPRSNPPKERPDRGSPGCGPCGDCGSGCGRPRPSLPF